MPRLISTLLLFSMFTIGSATLSSQIISTKHIDGLRDKAVRTVALTNCTLVAEPGKMERNATVVFRGDRIVSAGTSVAIPTGAEVRDLKGAYVYAGFVEPYASIGMGEQAKGANFDDDGNDDITAGSKPRAGKHWNDAIHPENNCVQKLVFDTKAVEQFQKLGFTVVQTNSTDGIMRGSSCVALAKSGGANEVVIKQNFAQWMSFKKGTSKTPYPTSLMGSIALLRQTFSDAKWYSEAQDAARKNPNVKLPEQNLALERIGSIMMSKTPIIFETEDEHYLMRAELLAKEFGLKFIYRGSGQEYRRLPSIAPLKCQIILPLNFPEVPDVSTPDRATDVSLEELRTWDASPSNAYWLDSAGISFAFTTSLLKEKDNFWKNLRLTVERGLSAEKALAGLTTIPAKMCGVDNVAGTIASGKLANLVISSGDIFSDTSSIKTVFVAGEEFIQKSETTIDLRGDWQTSFLSFRGSINVRGKIESPTITLQRDSLKIETKATFSGNTISFNFNSDTLGYKGISRVIARRLGVGSSATLAGTVTLPDGSSTDFSASWSEVYDDKKDDKKDSAKKDDKAKSSKPTVALVFPNMAYGVSAKPVLETVLLKNATVWTCGEKGKLEATDVLLKDGKIADVGQGLSASGARTIDCSGKHITPGIIDEHSHIAIQDGVNEGSHAVTAEVRIGDVVYSDDINIYRQLSGGVTSSHLLHGSANPMGGQLQLIKLRWGSDDEGLKFEGTPGTIKFALGENVKQSNWGDKYTVRYPQSRMGVEEIMRDAFQTALEYKKQMEDRASIIPARKDYQLETLLEIIEGRRFIHCHSYVQSEILMLMRLAEEFNFRVQTFTHILEGYKVASEMKKHGTTASSFSDWWAYKFEVYDAIPQNPAILHEAGVVTSINSDDAEMARRLNQESAKSVKYGGMSEVDALKMCTINPAIQMKVDQRVGSIEKGKEADVVVWNGNPLSNFSHVLHTFVDGRKYFDREVNQSMMDRDRAVRAALEQKALEAMAGGAVVSKTGTPAKKAEYECDTIDDEMTSETHLHNEEKSAGVAGH